MLNHTLTLNLLLAFLYFVLAKLGFAWGSFTSTATLLWPSSGLTLFGLLVFGNRVLPGLLLGAICSAQFLSLSATLGNTAFSFFIAFFNGTASILQAQIIAYCARSWYGRQFRTDPRSAIYFSLLILVGCTLASSLSNLALIYAQVLDIADAPQAWVVWWLGDSIGMLVMTPLLIWLHGRQLFRDNSQANAFLITCAGIGITLFTVAAVGHSERENVKKNIIYQSVTLQTLLQGQFDLASRDLTTLQGYFMNRPPSQDDFRNVSEPLLKNNLSLDDITWVNVSEKLESKRTPILVTRDGFQLSRFSDINFLWHTPDLTRYTAQVLETLQVQLRIAHTDLRWRPAEAERGDPPLSSLIPTIEFIAPLYTCAQVAYASTHKNCKLNHVIGAQLNLNRLMARVFEKTAQPLLSITLWVNTKAGDRYWLKWNHDHWEKFSSDYESFMGSRRATIAETRKINLVDSDWDLRVTPINTSAHYFPSLLQCSLLLIGLSLTATLGAYLNALYKHDQLIIENQHKLETEIVKQTEALHSANDWLLKEIEDRQLTQERLKASENHLRVLLDNIPDPIWFKSIEGNYISSNKAVEILFARNKQDYIGRTSADFADPELNKELQEFDAEVLQSDTAERKQIWMYLGHYKQERLMDTLKVALRDEIGNPIGILSIARDVTEQKQIETALQLAKETAEEATHAKSRFLANMSHEIRTPLNAILGYSQLLIADQHLTQQQRERLSAILNSGHRLLHLINDILDLSKIEAGALHLRFDYFDLHQEMLETVNIMREKARVKGLSLHYQIDLPAPAIVKSDRQKIGQIILNILGNAIKFTSRGEITFRVEQENSFILFHVIDTGPGIANKELQQLFSAFKQGKAGEEAGGTGLGLVISKHLAEHMKGELTLDSEEGKGTRAHLRLPLHIEYGARLQQQSASQPIKVAPGEDCNILVVEDDPASLDILVNLLRNMGCSVHTAQTGAEGLALAQSQAFSLVFTDIRMPVMSGTDMLMALRESIPQAQLPVVAVSASNLEHERSFYLEQGFDDFIGKPYEFADIYSALKQFTPTQFVVDNKHNPGDALVAENINWSAKDNVEKLYDDLCRLREALSAGEMIQSKKLFSQFHADDLGANYYHQLQSAIRHYDLVLAEKNVNELLNDIKSAIPSST